MSSTYTNQSGRGLPVDKTHRASWLLMALVTLFAIGWLMAFGPVSGRAGGTQLASSAADRPDSADSGAADSVAPVAKSIPEASLIHVKEFGEALAGPVAQRPAVLHVGYHVLYRGGHIAGSRYFGLPRNPRACRPCATQSGSCRGRSRSSCTAAAVRGPTAQTCGPHTQRWRLPAGPSRFFTSHRTSRRTGSMPVCRRKAETSDVVRIPRSGLVDRGPWSGRQLIDREPSSCRS